MMKRMAAYRAAYVVLGASLAGWLGYLFAKYFVLFAGAALHLAFPARYTFEHIIEASLSTAPWLRPSVAVACASYAALACYRFGRPSQV